MESLAALAAAAAVSDELAATKRTARSSMASKAPTAASPRDAWGRGGTPMDARDGLPSLKLGFVPQLRGSGGAASPSPLLNSFAPALFTMAQGSPNDGPGAHNGMSAPDPGLKEYGMSFSSALMPDGGGMAPSMYRNFEAGGVTPFGSAPGGGMLSLGPSIGSSSAASRMPAPYSTNSPLGTYNSTQHNAHMQVQQSHHGGGRHTPGLVGGMGTTTSSAGGGGRRPAFGLHTPGLAEYDGGGVPSATPRDHYNFAANNDLGGGGDTESEAGTEAHIFGGNHSAASAPGSGGGGGTGMGTSTGKRSTRTRPIASGDGGGGGERPSKRPFAESGEGEVRRSSRQRRHTEGPGGEGTGEGEYDEPRPQRNATGGTGGNTEGTLPPPRNTNGSSGINSGTGSTGHGGNPAQQLAAARAMQVANRVSGLAGSSADEAGGTPTAEGTSDSDYRPPHHLAGGGGGVGGGGRLRSSHPSSSLGDSSDMEGGGALLHGMRAVLDAAGIPDPTKHAAVVTDPDAIAAYMPTGNSSAAARALPPTAIAVLKAWMLAPEHFEYPYPTDAEKEALGAQCGVTVRQVSVWFTNARKRLWLPLRNKHSRGSKGSKGGDGTSALGSGGGRNGRGGGSGGGGSSKGNRSGATSSAGIDELLYGDVALGSDEDMADERSGQAGGMGYNSSRGNSTSGGRRGAGDEGSGEESPSLTGQRASGSDPGSDSGNTSGGFGILGNTPPAGTTTRFTRGGSNATGGGSSRVGGRGGGGGVGYPTSSSVSSTAMGAGATSIGGGVGGTKFVVQGMGDGSPYNAWTQQGAALPSHVANSGGGGGKVDASHSSRSQPRLPTSSPYNDGGGGGSGMSGNMGGGSGTNSPIGGAAATSTYATANNGVSHYEAAMRARARSSLAAAAAASSSSSGGGGGIHMGGGGGMSGNIGGGGGLGAFAQARAGAPAPISIAHAASTTPTSTPTGSPRAPGGPPPVHSATNSGYNTGSSSGTGGGSGEGGGSGRIPVSHSPAVVAPGRLPTGALSAHLRQDPDGSASPIFPYALSTIQPGYIGGLIENVSVEAGRARLQAVADALAANRAELGLMMDHLNAIDAAVNHARARLAV